LSNIIVNQLPVQHWHYSRLFSLLLHHRVGSRVYRVQTCINPPFTTPHPIITGSKTRRLNAEAGKGLWAMFSFDFRCQCVLNWHHHVLGVRLLLSVNCHLN